ncbi:MAG TPA: hypothetical protein VLQ48_05340 [Chloroflexia bacterium]|nr:hypothetical protein [Chloroflexia bacterium]
MKATTQSTSHLGESTGEHDAVRGRTGRTWLFPLCLFLFLVFGLASAVLLYSDPTPVEFLPHVSMLAPASQVLCVDDSGGSTGAPCANPTAFTSIQDGIVAASPGDEVRVAAGTYVASTGTSVVSLDRAITLTGGYPGGPSGWTTPGNENQTVIDGQNAREGIDYNQPSPMTVQNLTIVNGGIILDLSATVTNNLPVVTRALTQTAGTIAGTAPITVTSNFAWGGSGFPTQEGSGHTILLAGGVLTMASGTVVAHGTRVIDNFGTATWSSSGDFNMFSSSATFNNRASATFDILNNQTVVGGTFNNFGTITKSSSLKTEFNTNAVFNNSGLIQIDNGTFSLGMGSSTGTFNVAQGATLAICNCGSHFFQSSSAITGMGTFHSAGPVSTYISGTYSLPDLLLQSGTVQFDSVGANTASSMLTITQSGGSLAGSRTISVTNIVNWSGGAMQGSGHTDILPGAQLNITSGSTAAIQGGRTVNNFGTTNWSGTNSINITGGAVFNNRAGATFNIISSQSFGGFANDGTFNNAGTLVKTGAGDTSFGGVVGLNNSGLVQIEEGRLLIGIGSSTGTFNVAQGATLGICNCDTHRFQPSSAIEGAGTFESVGPPLTLISGTFTLPNLLLESGDVVFDSVGANTATSVMTLTMTAGSLSGSRTISVTNVLNWGAGLGHMAGSGHTDILPGARMDVSAGAFLQSGRVLNNYGTVNFVGASQFGTDLQMTGATFNNRPGGVVTIVNDAQLGDNGSNFGIFNNQGTFIKSTATGATTLSFGGGGSNFVNSGLVEVQTGTLRFVGYFPQTAGTTRMAGGNLQLTPFFPVTPFLQGGTLEGTGTVTGDLDNTGGTVSPGSGPGLMTITGNYTQGAGGTLNIELGGLTPITQYDRLAVGGTATLAGTLNTSAINGFTPQNGDSFTVLTYGSRSGVFSTIQGGTYTTNYNPNDLTLVVGGTVSTATPTGTAPATFTPTNTSTNTRTSTPTNTASNTPSITPSNTSTNTPSNTRTNTGTATITNTPSATPTTTPTSTSTGTPTQTPTVTSTPTRTNSPTNTGTPTNTSSATSTATATTACGVVNWVAGPTLTPGRTFFQGANGSDGKFYVAGGQVNSTATPFALVARFVPASNTWEAISPLPVPVGQDTVGAANGKLFVAGGYLGGVQSPSAITSTLQIYDIASGTWSFGAPMPTAVEAAGGAVLNGKFYVMGGDNVTQFFRTTQIYDIASNTWTTGALLPDAGGRSNTYATAADNLIYVYGGAIGSNFNSTDTLISYDPVGNTWTALGSAGTGGKGQFGAVSPYGPGRLLITDGADNTFNGSTTTRIYDIATGIFTLGPAMLGAHMGQAQGTLTDGRVIVASGQRINGATTTGVELLPPSGPPVCTPTITNTPTMTNTLTATSTPTGTATSTLTPSPVPGCWSIYGSPNLFTSNNLLDVDVVSANDVWAVGSGTAVGITATHALIEHWDGSAWNTVSATVANARSVFLAGVVVLAANDVWAVGNFYDSSGLSRTLIMHWNGTAWSQVASPNPGTDSNLLSSVDARTAGDVWAVGNSTSSGIRTPLTLHYDGSSWQAVSGLPSIPNFLELLDVKAIASDNVWAVGDTADTAEHPLTLHYNGTTWTLVSAPAGGNIGSLSAVDAVSAGDVWAVGVDYSVQHYRALTFHSTGSQWTLVSNPGNDPSLSYALSDLTALPSGEIWAVGQKRDSSLNERYTFTMHWGGAGWSIVDSPSVPGRRENYFVGVAAVSATDVWAVGLNFGSITDQQTLIERFTNPCVPPTATPTPTSNPSVSPTRTPTPVAGCWSIYASPNWPDASSSLLTDVEALTANDVWAVGTFAEPPNSTKSGLIEHWNGSVWSQMGLRSGGDLLLNDLAAVSTNDVWAVGAFKQTASSSYHTLIQHYDGVAWISVSSPNIGSGDSFLDAVDARASNDIWAIGHYGPSTDSRLPVVMHYNGSSWQLDTSLPSIPGFYYFGGLDAIAANNVWVVGATVSGGQLDPLLLHYTGGGTWTTLPVPQGSEDALLYDVSGVSTSDVWAVGVDSNTQHPQRAITLHWNGAAWSTVSNPGSDPVLNYQLSDVTALPSGEAWAVGSGGSGTTSNTLTMHWGGGGWAIVSSPNPVPFNYFAGVSAISPNDVWAAGYSYLNGASVTLIERFTNPCAPPSPTPTLTRTATRTPTRTATRTATVNPSFSATRTATRTPTITPTMTTTGTSTNTPTFTSTRTATHTGTSTATPTATPTCGIAWRLVDSPNAPNRDGNSLDDVVALSANDAWAVGASTNGPTFLAPKTLIEHWDGVAWSIVPSPNGDNTTGRANVLHAIAAVSTNDVWAVGWYDTGTNGYHALLLHWNGSVWALSPEPNVRLGPSLGIADVAALSANNVWVVGTQLTGSLTQSLILHWDGSAWSVVTAPTLAQRNGLVALEASSPTDIWAVGNISTTNPLFLHWNGTAWTQFNNPTALPGVLNDISAISANDIWAVGYRTDGSGLSLTVHYDGVAWSIVDTTQIHNAQQLY